MPTFERCPCCIARGVPMDEAPIRPEGTLCDRCLADRVLTTCLDHGFVALCCKCQLRGVDGSFVMGVGWVCAGCRWEEKDPA